MGSIKAIFLEEPVLRESALIGAMLFGAFNAFWARLVFFRGTPPYHYGARATGLFGLVGAISAAAVPLVGRLADRKGPRFVVGLAVTGSYRSLYRFRRIRLLWNKYCGTCCGRDSAGRRGSSGASFQPNSDLFTQSPLPQPRERCF